MLPSITTTHAIPQTLPKGKAFSEEETVVRCWYCLEVVGEAHDFRTRVLIQETHRCSAMGQAKKPAASVPYN